MNKVETMEQFWAYADKMEDGFCFAMLTDDILWEKWPVSAERKKELREKEGRLLDIRIFNTGKELRMFRGDIGRDFQGRSIDDGERAPSIEEYFDEEQYLDIDSKRSGELFAKEQKVLATGGGSYPLPIAGFENAKIRIRNYLGYYEETGQAYVKDWRLMDVFQEEE